MAGRALAAVTTLGAAAGALTWAVRAPSSGAFGPSVWRGKPGHKAIALTFDDGPHRGTLELLQVLAAHRAPATFFQCGMHVERAPEISRAVLAGGHEIGNHSWSHPNFALKSGSFIQTEFQRTQEAIARATGFTPSLARAPYGVRWFGFRAMQKQLGLLGVMWSVIGLDWKLSAEAIAQRVVSRARDGGIVCLHDGRGTLKEPDIRPTLEAVRRILPALLEKGYHFETVSRIL